MERQFRGRIVKGAGRASYFTGLTWVREQCLVKLGFTPHPGTLNVELAPENAGFIDEPSPDIVELVSPDPSFCNARALPVSIGPLPGAVILPADDVRIHGSNIVEIIAPLSVKDTLGVRDGEEVTLLLRTGKVSETND